MRLAYSATGEWIPHPTYEEGDASTFEIVVAGRKLDNGDVAVMMVEAGGTEAAWNLYEEGAPKVDEAALATALNESKRWISDVIDLQQQLVDAVIAEQGEPGVMSYTPQVDYSDEIYAEVENLGGQRVGEIMQIADKTERRPPRAPCVTSSSSASCPVWSRPPSRRASPPRRPPRWRPSTSRAPSVRCPRPRCARAS